MVGSLIKSCCVVLCLLVVLTPAKIAAQEHVSTASVVMPLVFEANQGQASGDYLFLARRDPVETLYSLEGVEFLAPGPSSTTGRLKIQWLDANAKPSVVGEQELPGYSNYFLGSDPSKWLRHISQYGQIGYHELYPGVDAIFHGTDEQLEHDFIVQAGANPERIGFRLDRPARLTPSGDLEIDLGASIIRLKKPIAYQEFGSARKEVPASFVLAQSTEVRIRLAAYDRSRALVIDPVFGFSTYLSGTSFSQISAVTTDPSGNIYVTGFTSAPDFPVTNASNPLCSQCADASQTSEGFISKLDPTGHTLLYSTFLGGSTDGGGFGTFASSIALDENGNILVAGVSSSHDFPRTGAVAALNPAYINPNYYFLASLTPDGSVLNYSGLVGGREGDNTNGRNGVMVLDRAGNAYLAGTTFDSNFQLTPGVLGPNPTSYPNDTLFVLKLDPTGKLVYSTLVPGNVPRAVGTSYEDNFPPSGITVDANGQATIAGLAGLGLSTTAGVLQPTLPVPQNVIDPTGGYLLQVNANATALNFATYLPGAAGAGALATDSSGNFYVTGGTNAADVPVSANGYQKSSPVTPPSDSYAAYVMKLNPQATSSLAATYLSGSGGSNFYGIALDSNSNVMLGGWAFSADFPLKNPFLSVYEVGETSADMVLAELNSDLSSLLFGSFLSSTDILGGSVFGALTVDSNNNLIVAGTSLSQGFPTTPNSFQPVPPTPANSLSPVFETSFISKLNLATPAPSVCFTPAYINFGSILINTPTSQNLTITNCGNAALQITGIAPSSPTVTGAQTCGAIAPGATCNVQLTFTPTDTSTTNGTITLSDNGAIPQLSISFSGTGGLPSVIYPPSIVLSDLLVGTTANFPSSFFNEGNGAWIISSVTATGDFSANNPCAAPILPPPPASQLFNYCTIGLTFAPTVAGVRSGTLTITDNVPGSPHVIQLSGNGLLTYATPNISVVEATASDAQIAAITVLGTNFYPASQVLVNGSPRTTHYSSEQYIYADATPADIAQVGELPVTVSTSTPGGGLSNTAPWAVYAPLRNIYVLHAVYEPHSALLYASIPPTSPTHANQVIVVNPTTATIVNSWSVGNGPDPLAVSDDGQFLYVGLDSDTKVAQVALPAGTVNFSTTLGNLPNSLTPMMANALEVFPGRPHSWAAALTSSEVTFPPFGQGIAIYDDAVQRPTAYLPGGTEWNSMLFIGSNTNLLYAVSPAPEPSTYGQFSVTSAGVSLLQSNSPENVAEEDSGGLLDTDGTSLYDDNGQVINPSSLATTYPFPDLASNIPGIKVDVPASRVYFSGGAPIGALYNSVIEAFDLNTQQLLGTIPTIEGMQRSDLFRWGANGLAFDTQFGIFVFRSSLTGVGALPPQFGVTSLSPATVPAGSGALPVKIIGTAFAAGDTVTANGAPIQATFVSATEIDATIPASLIASQGSVAITVTNPANQTGNLVLVVAPGAPRASLSATTLNFGSLLVGATSPAQTLTISNVGSGVMTVASVTLVGSGYTQTNNCTTVAPGATCSVNIVFTPASVGGLVANLIVASDGSANPLAVILNGTGTDIQIAPGTSGSTATVQAGQAANYGLNISPEGGFSGQVTFTCTGLPQYASCTITPPSANLTTAAVSVSVSIATSQTQTAMQLGTRSELAAIAGLRWVGLFALLPFWRFRRHLRRDLKPSVPIALIVLLFAALWMNACGGGSSGGTTTPPPSQTTLTTLQGTYTVNFVVTTAAGESRSLPLTLVVK